MSKHIEVPDEFVNSLMDDNSWGRFGLMSESKKSDAEIVEKVEQVLEDEEVNEEAEVEVHSCPLCETVLDEALSDEVLEEHISSVLDMVNEIISEQEDSDEEDVIEECEDPEEEQNFTQS